MRLSCLAALVCTTTFSTIGFSAEPTRSSPVPVRIMAVGDSITEGADFFSNYRFPLWEKLFAAGYVVEFVGTRTSSSRVGPLAHEGYGGKNTEQLAAMVPKHFAARPADIVLLHSGHNHTVEEQPVPGIVAATERLIQAFRTVNPNVTVLLAQVIPAGKLPKYSYLPELNQKLAGLAARLDSPAQRVVLVDHAAAFNWETDTVTDKVHPNAIGAGKMAGAWFAALETVLPPPARTFALRQLTYTTSNDISLQLHVFEPPSNIQDTATRPRPAIVFFFGGGWTHGTPIQWYPECAHFADRGFVAISADYRIASTHEATPFDGVDDARNAIRWIRTHAAALSIDPNRIYAAGASAGGHLAAMTAFETANASNGTTSPVSTRPNALLLWYPVLDTSPEGFGHALFGERFADFSPLHRLASYGRTFPPTLVLIGTADGVTSEATVRRFQQLVRGSGGVCEVELFPNGRHPLYAYREGGGPLRDVTLAVADRFLSRLPDHLPATGH
jgi:acetyl esterase/lipase